MSASYLVDLANTVQVQTSVAPTIANSPASGTTVGQIVDLLHANSFCNVVVAGGPSSGVARVTVQTADDTASGSFGDPTSGTPAGSFGPNMISGGNAWVNSGLIGSGTYGAGYGGVVNNAPVFCSGQNWAFGFNRTQRYARAIVNSGSFDSMLSVSFVSQLKTTGGSGTAGFTFSPGSGQVNV